MANILEQIQKFESFSDEEIFVRLGEKHGPLGAGDMPEARKAEIGKNWWVGAVESARKVLCKKDVLAKFEGRNLNWIQVAAATADIIVAVFAGPTVALAAILIARHGVVKFCGVASDE